MPTNRVSQDNSWFVTLIAMFLIVAALWFARLVLIPIALAMLLTFLLAPWCDRLERWRLGRIGSVVIVSAVSFVVLAAIAWVVAGQVIELAAQIPHYRGNIRDKIEAVEIAGAGPVTQATENIKQLMQELLELPPEATVTADGEAVAGQAVPVQIVHGPLQPLDALSDALEPVWDPLVSAAIVVVFVIFMLLQRDDLRDRMIHLIGRGRAGGVTMATQAIDDAARRVSRFLRMQLVINGTYGLAAGIGLFIIGVPGAVVWGVVAALVRFIPYVGPWLGAVPPIALAFAAFDTWPPVMLTLSLFVVIELISNNVMEPWLYGTRTGVSSVAILASAVFWAWLWGPMGLVLATPLTVCVVVLGRYIPRFEFLSVLLSDEPSLSPADHFYQRLLAMDEDDVYEFAEKFLGEKTLVEFYDTVLLPVLELAERDRHRDRLEPDREQVVYQIMRELIEELGEKAALPPTADDTTESKNPQAASSDASKVVSPRIICVPADDLADQISCMMLSQLLSLDGLNAQVIGSGRLVTEVVDQIMEHQPDYICVGAVPPQTLARLRHICKRLSVTFPKLKIVVGFWNVSDLSAARKSIKSCQADRMVPTLAEAIALLRG